MNKNTKSIAKIKSLRTIQSIVKLIREKKSSISYPDAMKLAGKVYRKLTPVQRENENNIKNEI